ncbi:MAG: ATP-dependent helicase [Ilumatobacteraceae bacterium]|nr:ATP-dependent helicase [Ilumatobacteraceae bacterium]
MTAPPPVDDLDEQQRHAVTTPSRLVAVIAGAGSGKTRVLTRRIAHRVAAGTADARHTLVLTFTREAAGELRRRLPALGIGEPVEAGTFHAVMLAALRQRWRDEGQPAPTVTADRRRLVAASGTSGRLEEVLAEIDWAAARGIAPTSYPEAARRAGRRPAGGLGAAADAYSRYTAEKRRRGVIDLDDVLALAVRHLEQDPVFADALRWRYRHLLVDEAQDLNPLQHRIVDLLRRGSDDVFLVGDPAQAIYGFNGADPSLLLEVETRFPGVEVVRLPANHRSTPQVVDVAAFALGGAGPSHDLHSVRPDGPAVRVVACTDEHHEAATVVEIVLAADPSLLRRRRGLAVLARTHAQLAELRGQLVEAGVSIRSDVLPPPLRAAVGEAARCDAAHLRAWANDALDHDGPHRLVAEAVLDFLREHPAGDGAGFRTWVATTAPFGGDDLEGIELLTFHGAKGREWHSVVVTGVETGLVPHRTATTIGEQAEERRLLYVALTRATDELTVTWASRRGGYQRRRSPFLEGLALPEPPPAVAPPLPTARRDRTRADRLDRLRAWRAHAARAAAVLPEHLLSDDQLRHLVDDPPGTAEELAATTGVGVLTARRLLPGLLAALADDQSERSTTTGA